MYFYITGDEVLRQWALGKDSQSEEFLLLFFRKFIFAVRVSYNDIMSPFQGEDTGLTPVTRSKSLVKHGGCGAAVAHLIVAQVVVGSNPISHPIA